MKTLNDLANMLDKWANKIDEKAEKGLEKTAQQVYQDIVENPKKDLQKILRK